MGILFGTDGVRGIANSELTCELGYKLGRIGGYILTEGKKRPKIVIGMDTRISGSMLEGAVSSGLCSVGIDVLYIGVIPTPAVAHIIRKLGADGGIMISASHNPVEYNGIKFFDSDGFKLSDETENKIEKIILEGANIEYYPTDYLVGVKSIVENPVKLYTDYLEDTISIDFKGMKIAMDCGNGAAYIAAPQLFHKLGAEVYVINNKPNGININVNCGSTNPEVIQRFVNDTGADVGLSFDGDADRLIAVDEMGEIIDGDHIMAVCGIHLMSKNKLHNKTIVGTVMSNLGLDICLKERQINIVKTQVGDRYVLEEMKKNGHALGGEQSGHIIFLEHNTTGDGLLTAIQLVSAVKEQNQKLSELSSVMKTLPQVLINAEVNNLMKDKYMEDEVISNSIKNLELEFHGNGRVLVRPSGTEPLVRVMIEGENKEVIMEKAIELANIIETRLR